jgi:hypothetical protein
METEKAYPLCCSRLLGLGLHLLQINPNNNWIVFSKCNYIITASLCFKSHLQFENKILVEMKQRHTVVNEGFNVISSMLFSTEEHIYVNFYACYS